MRRFPEIERGNLLWSRMAIVLAVIFFMYFADGILSDWIPSYMQDRLGGSFAMGIMMSFSSIFGFGADLIFPMLFRKASSRRMVLMAISSMLMAAGFILWTLHFVNPAIFVLVMAMWGLYYEFINFGVSAYVVKTAGQTERASVWSIISVFKSLAYFVGPLAGTWLYFWKGNVAVIVAYILLALIAYGVWALEGFKDKEKEDGSPVDFEKVNILDEMSHWGTLFEHIWPILCVSLTLGIIDATFWTTGVVMSDRLAKDSWLGSFFVPAYTLPSVFISFVVAKMGIYQKKKKISEIFTLVTGFLLVLMGMTQTTGLMVLLSLLVGVTTSVAWPLLEAVYTDIYSRMGKEQKHMMGLSSSTINIAYIVGPIAAGYLASVVGEVFTMKLLGFAVVVISAVLLLVTPRKLKLPQKEIKTWKVGK